jgi:hypothetical protein
MISNEFISKLAKDINESIAAEHKRLYGHEYHFGLYKLEAIIRQNIVDESANLIKNPEDHEDWLRLARKS